MFGAPSSIATVASTVPIEKNQRRNLSRTVAANFQSLVTWSSSSWAFILSVINLISFCMSRSLISQRGWMCSLVSRISGRICQYYTIIIICQYRHHLFTVVGKINFTNYCLFYIFYLFIFQYLIVVILFVYV